MNLVFMGTPLFAVPTLAALIETGHNVVAVYSQPPRPAGRGQKETPSPVHRFALEKGIPVFTPTSLKPKDVQEQFATHQADAAVVAAYGLLLPKPILETPKYGCLNVHPSKLPRWRGAAPIQRTLMAGDTDTEICIMQMDEGMDTGPVLLREHLDVPATMTGGELHDVTSAIGAKLMVKALRDINTLKPVQQPSEGATHAAKIHKEELLIDWSKPAQEIYNIVRALNPAPCARAVIHEENVKIHQVEIAPGNGEAGTTLDDALTIACGNGAVKIKTLQRPGKKPMDALEVLRGWPVPKGIILC